jgi:ferredoxin-type protein NapF
MNLSRYSRYLRPAVQAFFFIVFILIFIGLAYPAAMPLSNPLMAMDPLVTLALLFFYRGSWIPSFLFAGALLVGSAILGRAFCGWVCPVGLLADISGRFSLKITGHRLGFVQYGLLAAVLLSAFVTLDLLSVLDPFVIFQRSVFLLSTLSGVPVVLLMIIAGSMLVPRLWCRICPAGGLLGVVSVASPFGRRLGVRCTSCMKCRNACPMGAISRDNKWDATACTKCLDCERACPESAISFSPSRPAPVFSASRRSALAAGAFLGLFAIAKSASAAVSNGRPLIRPPGSLAETRFNVACVRCEACAKACPGNVITPAPLEFGLDRFYTPRLSFAEGKCERCGTCGAVCPTGAISAVPEGDMKIGTAEIDRDRCIAWHGRKCLVCAEVCPKQAISGLETLQPDVIGSACIGCGSCEHNCPAPETAIVVSSAGERRRDG